MRKPATKVGVFRDGEHTRHLLSRPTVYMITCNGEFVQQLNENAKGGLVYQSMSYSSKGSAFAQRDRYAAKFDGVFQVVVVEAHALVRR